MSSEKYIGKSGLVTSLRKGGLLLSISVFIIMVFNNCIPYYFGNSQLQDKIAYLHSHSEDYNTLVIGSSFIYRQFDPVRFDETTKVTRSFNLGTPGMRFMESSYIIENLINDSDFKTTSIKHVLFLTQSNLDIPPHALHTIRAKYVMDVRRLLTGFRFFKNNLEQLKHYLITFFERTFFVKMRKDLLRSIVINRDSTIASLGENAGYVALDDEPSQKYRSTYFNRNNKGQKRIGYDQKYNAKTINGHLSNQEKCFLEELMRLQEICNQKDLVLHFLFLPNDKFHNKVELPNELYLGDGVDFPEYFLEAYRFDEFHLNKKGAGVFSERLGEMFLRNLQISESRLISQ